jgi:hypothetical protein
MGEFLLCDDVAGRMAWKNITCFFEYKIAVSAINVG